MIGPNLPAMGNPALVELIAPEYIEGRESLPLSEVRARRGKCQAAEEVLSLQRRMVQGRLDIVQSEIGRRSGTEDLATHRDLIADLPAILADHGGRAAGPGRLTSVGGNHAELDAAFDHLSSVLNSIVSPQQLSELEELSQHELQDAAHEMEKLERSISQNRHSLHHNIDALQEEIVRRYKSGEASVENLLKDNI